MAAQDRVNGQDQLGEEVNTFRRLKKIQDRLFHGVDIPEESLPAREVQQLFDKYLRNHLRRNA
ncbi:MAG: hypothetical protein ABI988_07470 [Nitrospirota bacterium]